MGLDGPRGLILCNSIITTTAVIFLHRRHRDKFLGPGHKFNFCAKCSASSRRIMPDNLGTIVRHFVGLAEEDNKKLSPLRRIAN